MNGVLNRITINSKVCKGKPTIRNMRFTVTQLLDLLASGMSTKDLLKDYPYLEKEDIQACLMYASMMANTKNITHFAD